MPYVELRGVDLWFQDTGGSGAPVVFLHAASGASDCWVNQTPAFTLAGYRCVAYDRRGWGKSQPKPTGAQPGDPSGDLHGPVGTPGAGPASTWWPRRRAQLSAWTMR